MPQARLIKELAFQRDMGHKQGPEFTNRANFRFILDPWEYAPPIPGPFLEKWLHNIPQLQTLSVFLGKSLADGPNMIEIQKHCPDFKNLKVEIWYVFQPTVISLFLSSFCLSEAPTT